MRRSHPFLSSLLILIGQIGCSETPTGPSEHWPGTMEERLSPPSDAWIAFVSTRDGSPQIYVANAHGAVVPLASGQWPSWSPDGRRIAFSGTGLGIYVMDADGSNVQWIANGIQPAWSPDGGKIVFSGGLNIDGIFVVNADGSGLTRLLPENYAVPPGYEGDHCSCSPTWSPDGRHIAFVVENYDDVWQIHVMNADGSDPHPLPAPSGIRLHEEDPAWSPDASGIAFAGRDGYIYEVDMEGVVRVLVPTHAFGGRPGWSPDGGSLLFTRGDGFPVTDQRIYTVSLETGSERRAVPEAVSPAQRPYDDYDAVWRPTAEGEQYPVPVPASRMAFGMCFEWGWDASFDDVCDRGGIVILDPDGSEERFVSEAPRSYFPTDLAWSPDGSKVAFAGFQHCESTDTSPCPAEIYVMNTDGSSVARLTNSLGASSADPAWTPDGSRIAYVTTSYDSAGLPTSRLRVMNADGSGTEALGGLVGTSPAWSPDAERLAFSAEEDGGTWGIYAADADGSNPRRLTHESVSHDFRPSWSPDGRRIAFTRSWTHPDGSGSCQIFVMVVDGSNLLQLTQDAFCAHDPAWSSDGAMIAYDGTARPGSYGIELMNTDGTGARLIRPTAGWPSRVAWAPLP